MLAAPSLDEGRLPEGSWSQESGASDGSADSSATANRKEPHSPRVILLPRCAEASVGADTRHSELLEEWEGTVLDVQGRHMCASLRSVLGPRRGEELTTIDLDAVSSSDLPLVVPGAVFYWLVGYVVEPHRQKSLMSTIRFRRLPAWMLSEIDRARKEAAAYDEFFSRG